MLRVTGKIQSIRRKIIYIQSRVFCSVLLFFKIWSLWVNVEKLLICYCFKNSSCFWESFEREARRTFVLQLIYRGRNGKQFKKFKILMFLKIILCFICICQILLSKCISRHSTYDLKYSPNPEMWVSLIGCWGVSSVLEQG